MLAGRSFLKPGARITDKTEPMKMKLRWIIMGGAILLVAFLVFLPERPTPLPDELVGVWTTSHPKYADRYFDLTKTTVIFGTGKESIDTNVISNVEKTLQDKASYTQSTSIVLEDRKISFPPTTTRQKGV